MAELIEVDPLTAKEWADNGEAELIDVREEQELMSYSIAGTSHNPMSQFNIDAIPTDGAKKLIFVCAHGIRSAQVGEYLLSQDHISEAYNMTGGVAAWAGAGLPSA
jgi:rhodanese-related sulfurtransferase